MSDDLSKPVVPDRSRINIDHEQEVRYWTDRYGISKGDLKAAVHAAGDSASAVRSYLLSKRG